MENFFIDSFLPTLALIIVLLGIPYGLFFLKKANSNNEEKKES